MLLTFAYYCLSCDFVDCWVENNNSVSTVCIFACGSFKWVSYYLSERSDLTGQFFKMTISIIVIVPTATSDGCCLVFKSHYHLLINNKRLSVESLLPELRKMNLRSSMAYLHTAIIRSGSQAQHIAGFYPRTCQTFHRIEFIAPVMLQI